MTCRSIRRRRRGPLRGQPMARSCPRPSPRSP